jgi:hypothetical protein
MHIMVSRNGASMQHGGNYKHCGEQASKAIASGVPFAGLAQAMEQSVQAELEEQGRGAIVSTAAIRLETAARLYYAAVMKAAETGDLQALDRYVARFGWLQSAALRGWAQVRDEEREHKGQSLDVLLGKAQEVTE